MAISIPSSVASAAVPDRTASGRDSSNPAPAAAGGAAASSNPDPGQDQVTLSSDAVAAAQADPAAAPGTPGTQPGAAPAAPGTQPTAASAAQVAQGTQAARTGAAAPAPGKASVLKSFAYGSLGLEHPDQQEHDPDGSYSAGRWLAAAVTAGAVISLLV